MPRIKQTKMRLELNPNKTSEETIIYTMYDNRDRDYGREPEGGRFYIELPKPVADALGQTEVRAGSQMAVMSLFQETIEKYKKLNIERNRIIAYSFELDPHPKQERRYSSSGLAIRINATVYDEIISISGGGDRRYSYEEVDDIDLGFPGKCDTRTHSFFKKDHQYPHQVPFTKQNEKFFRWVATRMSELINALANIEAPDKMLETINAGRLLPLGNPESED
jgi:hypothetical protein